MFEIVFSEKWSFSLYSKLLGKWQNELMENFWIVSLFFSENSSKNNLFQEYISKNIRQSTMNGSPRETLF